MTLSDWGLTESRPIKQLCYLACVSRLLARPLAVLPQSSSAAGKTALMDATLRMMPSEDVVRYSDADRRGLHVVDSLVKHFKRSAVNQEILLAAFEEQGWPNRIDDPFPPTVRARVETTAT